MTTTELTPDELRLLNAYRVVKQRGHGDVTAAVRHGQMAKLWTVDKWDREDDVKPRLKEGEKP